MNLRRYALVVSLSLVAIFIAANLIVSTWLSGARLDATEDRLYSLSPGTREIVGKLAEPIDFTFYFSRRAAARDPQILAYGERVREFLRAYVGRSDGKIRLIEIDPARYSDAEDRAIAGGIAPLRPDAAGEPIYFGLIGSNEVDERIAIPAFGQEREPYLEYEVTRLVSELERPRQPKVALITSLPWDVAALADPQAAAEQPLFLAELARAATIETVARDFTSLPRDCDVVVVVQPWALSGMQLYALDQFILQKGRAFIALDPAALSAAAAPVAAPLDAAISADLRPLLSHWGVTVSPDVALDRERALQVESVNAAGQTQVLPQPLFFAAPPQQMSDADLVTAALRRGINFGAAGALTWSKLPGVTITPLIWTSKATARIPASEALSQPAPETLLAGFKPSGRSETLAARITGLLPSAFAGPPPGGGATYRNRSARPAEIVLVSDVDFLSDDFYVAGQDRAAAADNSAFALNAIDLLAGSDALISLRSRAPAARRLDVIDSLRSRAEQRLVQTQARLQKALAETEQRLTALQSKGQGSGFFSGNLGAEMSPGEKAEIERFRARGLALRAELRGVERDYRRDVDRLQTWIVALNIWLPPILVILVGVFVFWRRSVKAAAVVAPDVPLARAQKDAP